MNTATSEALIDSTVKPISRAPRSAAARGAHALLDVAADVLEHHDGVVDDEAGGDGQRHQRQVVEAVAEQVHDAEGADQRDRHGDAGDERGAHVAQEHEHDQDHQHDRRSAASARRRAARRGSAACGRASRAGRRPPGATPSSCGRTSRTRSTVSMMLAPGLRKSTSSTAGLPLARPAVRRSSTESSTVATSDSRSTAPVGMREDDRPVLLGLEQLVVGLDLPARGRRRCSSPFGPPDVGRGDARRARPRGRGRSG